MIEKIKNIGWMGGGILLFLLAILISIFFVRGGVWLVEHYIDTFTQINGIIFWLILLLLVLSIFPKIRAYTGAGIVYGTLAWGALFWLLCLFITYQNWGLLGTFIGFMFVGVGIFATAILSLLFSGQWSVALIMTLNLLFIFGMRLLGIWIVAKHKDKNETRVLPEDTSAINELWAHEE